MNLKKKILSYGGSMSCVGGSRGGGGGGGDNDDNNDYGSTTNENDVGGVEMGQSTSTPNIVHSSIQQQSAATAARTSTTTLASYRRRSFRSPFTRRKKDKQQLSATFQVPININGYDALNINTATEEQFMTLPGINRRIAQSIVDHRFAIGGRFQRVDDLALVSGIGAAKLEQIRPEICIKRVTRSQNGSTMSSRSPSLDSVFSETNINNNNNNINYCQPVQQQQQSQQYNQQQQQIKQPIINVNTSTVFQLQQINGMNQELAANLVDYRNRKGPFKSLDDLIKVKGLSHARLGAIRSTICCNDNDIPKTPKFNHRHNKSSLSTIGTSAGLTTTLPSQKTNINNNILPSGHRKSISMPIKMNSGDGNPASFLINGFNNVPVNDIFDLLGAYSHRPIVEDNYNNTRNGYSSIRLATWNLDRMCIEKSINLGVKEVICRTILENKLSIICVQEILEPKSLADICNELNSPKLRRVIEWKQNTRNWKYQINSTCADGQLNGLGFIYDADRCDLIRNECFDISFDESSNIGPSAYLAAFRLSDWTCYVLNTYLRYYDLEKINLIIETVESHLNCHENNLNNLTVSNIFMVVGDFTGTTIETEMAESILRLTKPQTIKEMTKEIEPKKISKINLKNLGFYNVIEPNCTSISQYNTNNNNNNNNDKNINNNNRKSLDNATGNDDGNINEGVVSVTTTNQTNRIISSQIFSSCNIFCRELMPTITTTTSKSILRSAETLYKIKTSFTNNNDDNNINVPSNNINGVNGLLNNGVTANTGGGDRLCGYSGIIRQGLCHMAIPKNYSWGGPASEHCPVWIELFKLKERCQPTTITATTKTKQLLSQSFDIADFVEQNQSLINATEKRQNYQNQRRRNSLNSNTNRILNGFKIATVPSPNNNTHSNNLTSTSSINNTVF